MRARARRRRAPSTGGAARILLLDDPDPHFGPNLGVQADRDAEHAQRLDGVVKVDLPLFDRNPLSLELVRNVGRGD
jgi:hypothetical protein